MAGKAFVLRIAPSGVNRVAEALETGRLIIGWAEACGLLDSTLDWWQFREIIHRTYHAGDASRRRAGAATGHMWRFVREMSDGDLVVVPDGSQFYVAQVSGPAFYDESRVEEDSAYRRCVTWLNEKRGIPRSMAKSALVSRMKTYGTSATATDLLEEIKACVREAEGGRSPSFESDLRRSLTQAALKQMRDGRMDSYGFEALIERVMRALGAIETRLVPRSQDKGIDLYATFLVAGAFRQVIGIQAKHWQPEPPVGEDVIHQLTNGIEEGVENNVTLGMVVTSGEYSPEAVKAAEQYEDRHGIPIELVDGEQFAGLMVEHGFGTVI